MGPVPVGSAATVADELERWMEANDVDGLDLAWTTTPGTFLGLIELVVPELQRRGRCWGDDDERTTAREELHGPRQTRVREDHPAAVHRRQLSAKSPIDASGN